MKGFPSVLPFPFFLSALTACIFWVTGRNEKKPITVLIHTLPHVNQSLKWIGNKEKDPQEPGGERGESGGHSLCRLPPGRGRVKSRRQTGPLPVCLPVNQTRKRPMKRWREKNLNVWTRCFPPLGETTLFALVLTTTTIYKAYSLKTVFQSEQGRTWKERINRHWMLGTWNLSGKWGNSQKIMKMRSHPIFA